MKQVTRQRQKDDTKFSLVVDGNNLLKISLVNDTMNSKGEEYGAVISFLRMLGNVLKKKDFDYCVVAWDGEGSGVLRWQIYEDYKANRGKKYWEYDPNLSEYSERLVKYQQALMKYSKLKKGVEDEDISFERQRAIIRSILEELCIRQYVFDKVEGDDIIAYYVKYKKENEKVVIMSSDKDLTQLISDSVIIYNPRIRDFITKDNSVERIGITHQNVVLEKILCGDSSDNIKGVKGLGEATLIKLFPFIKDEKTDLKAILERSRSLLEERAQNKKKPLKALENIVNKVTDGCQGEKLYEINKKIIDLSEPLLTKDAEESLKNELYGIMDTSDRTIKNVYSIIRENDMSELFDESKFSEIFSSYERIRMMEERRFKEYSKK